MGSLQKRMELVGIHEFKVIYKVLETVNRSNVIHVSKSPYLCVLDTFFATPLKVAVTRRVKAPCL